MDAGRRHRLLVVVKKLFLTAISCTSNPVPTEQCEEHQMIPAHAAAWDKKGTWGSGNCAFYRGQLACLNFVPEEDIFTTPDSQQSNTIINFQGCLLSNLLEKIV
jgi:hypothetical protein